MIICGVELTGSDAVVCLLHLEHGQFLVPDCRVRKVTLKKGHTREDLQQFQFSFAKLMSDYSVDKVVIRERMPKGKFAGGAISFKLEAAIQLIAELDVELFSAAQIKTALAENPLPVPFAETGLKVFQEPAFTVAYAAHMLK
ncbi:MAG: DUF3010 family protein [Oceanospirillales bacterium]|uniref:DUF3010 family protein n=1 Tax=Marinobacterium halophilum TaxID=267374 RepID=A0A2P8F4S5_9GAMM|nr:DUF3010 family protein [Marinobacterium halophilum]MBR9828087.1 DUF3010 family protein [Oceanospirillales bacterium]PSL16700.1 Protein of unknown function (DUF3010) [Marinobacterium halophilum]